jgi:hypothetical protein
MDKGLAKEIGKEVIASGASLAASYATTNILLRTSIKVGIGPIKPNKHPEGSIGWKVGKFAYGTGVGLIGYSVGEAVHDRVLDLLDDTDESIEFITKQIKDVKEKKRLARENAAALLQTDDEVTNVFDMQEEEEENGEG